MKPSEIFEGENSSLKKTFDEAVKKHTPDIVKEYSNQVPFRPTGKYIEQQRLLFEKVRESKKYIIFQSVNGTTHILPQEKLDEIKKESYQQGFKDGEQKGREEAVQDLENARDSDSCECDNCFRWRPILEALKDK